VCENRVLRRISGPQGDKVTGEWRKLHNEELSDLGRACTTYWREEAYTVFWRGNLGERFHLEDPGVDGKIILRRIFRKGNVGLRTG
jgi:hypothetical protein